jgi:hypothetical protein
MKSITVASRLIDVEQKGKKPLRLQWKKLPLVLICIIVGMIYLWFISIGTWIHISQTSTYYYRMLADAFLSGSPALLEKPDPRLLELINPYSQGARLGIPVLNDATFFRGKYYLYYGPVPALFLSGFIFVFGKGFSDGYFVFGAALATLVFSTLILNKIWNNYYNHLPIELLYISVAFIGLAHPIPWVLNAARIYEAAIFVAIAFLIAGLYFAFGALEGYRANLINLALAGLFWGLAIGTRFSQAGAIALLCGVIVIRLLPGKGLAKTWKESLANLAALLVPIALVLVLMGWYNYIRFGNPLELGYRYTFGYGGVNLSNTFDVFNPRAILSNLDNYFLNPFKISNSFPFITIALGNSAIYVWLTHSDLGHTNEYIAGILLTTPVILFSCLVFWHIIRRLIDNRRLGLKNIIHRIGSNQGNSEFVTMAVGAASVINLVPLLFFYVTSMRYVLDFLPLLTFTAVVGTWSAYNANQKTVWKRRLTYLVILLGTGYSILVSLLLAISEGWERIQTMNPVLFDRLVHIFAH